MALRVNPLLSQSLLMVLAFLHVSGLNLGQGPGPAPGPFLRSKRANSFLLEEILPGNLERECLEEVCNYEEAREVFEDHHLTAEFWASYYDGDQCESAPCGNGGNCTDLVGGFYCTCPAPFYGETCELGPETRPKTGSDPNFNHELDLAPQRRDPAVCRTSGPYSCEQLCSASEFSFSCSCLTGFRLQSDGKHCAPEVKFPCGQIPEQLQLNSSSYCTNHTFPWQVSVLDRRGVQLCGGALLGHSLVLTSAHCLQSHLGADLDPHQIFIRLSGQRRALQVHSIDVHERFSMDHHDYDLAILQTPHPLHVSSALFHLCIPAHRDHAENVLMHAGKLQLAEGCRSTARSVTLDDCRKNNISHGLSNKMFCLETKPRLNQDWEMKPGLNRNQRAKPELGQDDKWAMNQTKVRTTDQMMNHSQDWTRASGYSNDQRNKENDSPNAENGFRQGLSSSQSRPIRNNKKIHSYLDQQRQYQTHARLNQTQPGPFQDQSKPTGPNGDQQRVDLHFNSTGPDQDHLKHSGLKRDQPHLAQAQRQVSGLFRGAPAVSVDHGTAYLVGLLTSAAPPQDSGAQVLVFTKLSRHMTWLQRRLGHMTPPQVNRQP